MIYFLHDAIKMVLRKKAKPMTAKEIADLINRTKIFKNVNGTAVSEKNVQMRVFLHPEIFKYDFKEKLISFNPSYKDVKQENKSDSKFNT